MDAAPFLKNEDWEGYKQKFFPVETKPQRKDLESCEYCGGLIVRCGKNGDAQGVCTECAVVAWEGLAEHTTNNTEWGSYSKDRIHVYSRLRNFKDFLRRMQAHQRSQMLDTDRERLKHWISLQETKITPTEIVEGLRQLGLLAKHRLHKQCLARELGGWQAPHLTHHETCQLIFGFAEVEKGWLLVKHGTRKIFMSYPFVYDQLCARLGFEHLRFVPQLNEITITKTTHTMEISL